MLCCLALFDVKLHYTDRHRLPADVEHELGLVFRASAAELVPHCDVVTINDGRSAGCAGDVWYPQSAPARSWSPGSRAARSATST